MRSTLLTTKYGKALKAALELAIYRYLRTLGAYCNGTSARITLPEFHLDTSRIGCFQDQNPAVWFAVAGLTSLGCCVERSELKGPTREDILLGSKTTAVA
jgi:hypothetical protein